MKIYQDYRKGLKVNHTIFSLKKLTRFREMMTIDYRHLMEWWHRCWKSQQNRIVRICKIKMKN